MTNEARERAGKRFVNFFDGRGVIDTQIHPKVLAAQEAEAKRLARKRKPKKAKEESDE
jgi:hypothetical protein